MNPDDPLLSVEEAEFLIEHVHPYMPAGRASSDEPVDFDDEE